MCRDVQQVLSAPVQLGKLEGDSVGIKTVNKKVFPHYSCLFVCLLSVVCSPYSGKTHHHIDFELSMCVVDDPGMCKCSFDPVWTREAFSIDKNFTLNASSSALAPSFATLS